MAQRRPREALDSAGKTPDPYREVIDRLTAVEAELVNQCESDIKAQAMLIHGRSAVCGLEDLMQEGRGRVLWWLRTFDRSKPFRPFLLTCLKNAMIDAVRRGTPDVYWEHRQKYQTAKADLEKAGKPNPTREEIANRMGIDERELEEWLRIQSLIEPKVEDASKLEDDSNVEAKTADPGTLELLRWALQKVDPVGSVIFAWHIWDRRGFKEIAEQLGLQESNTRSKFNKASAIVEHAIWNRLIRGVLGDEQIASLAEWYSDGRYRKAPPDAVASAMASWEPWIRGLRFGSAPNAIRATLRLRYFEQRMGAPAITAAQLSAEFDWAKPLVVMASGPAARERLKEMGHCISPQQLSRLAEVYVNHRDPRGEAEVEEHRQAMEIVAAASRGTNYCKFGPHSPMTARLIALIQARYLDHKTPSAADLANEISGMAAVVERWQVAPRALQQE